MGNFEDNLTFEDVINQTFKQIKTGTRSHQVQP